MSTSTDHGEPHGERKSPPMPPSSSPLSIQRQVINDHSLADSDLSSGSPLSGAASPVSSSPSSPLLVATQRKEIGLAHRVNVRPDHHLTADDVLELVGHVIVGEGGIAQGKTTLTRALARLIQQVGGVRTKCFREPTDLDALAEFMKFQKPLPDDASASDKEAWLAGRQAAAVKFQFSMMRRRTDIMSKAAEMARNGVIPIIDRGPWGDATFMASTFRAYGVSKDDEISYIVELIDRYRRIDFGKKDFLILRVDAPVAVTYERYLDREKDTPGNKYPPEYMQAIEDSHDACARSWGPYVIYDNSRVAYIRPTSPFDDAGKPTHGSPEDGAVRSVLAELCSLARSMRLTGIRQHMQNSYATADAAARGYQLAAVSRPTTGSATYS